MKTLLLLSTLLVACGPEPTWDGTVYPDRRDLTTHIHYGSFQSASECLDTGEALAGANGTYECGYDCRPFYEGSEVRVCDDTVGPSDTRWPSR